VLSGPLPGPLLGLIIATVGTTPPLAATVSQVAPGYVYKGTINFIGPEQPLPPEEVGLVVVGAVVLGALVVGALVEGAEVGDFVVGALVLGAEVGAFVVGALVLGAEVGALVGLPGLGLRVAS